MAKVALKTDGAYRLFLLGTRNTDTATSNPTAAASRLARLATRKMQPATVAQELEQPKYTRLDDRISVKTPKTLSTIRDCIAG